MISIITCKRPGGVSYVEGLLGSLEKEGLRAEVFVDEPGPIGVRPDNKRVGWKALEAAYEIGEDLLFLEDDARPLFPGAIAAAVAYPVPEWAAWSSLCDCRDTGWTRTPAIYFQMSQAVKIPNRSLYPLLQLPRLNRGDWDAVTGFDIAMAVTGHAAGWLYEQGRKCFEHIGYVSAAHPWPKA